VPLLVVLAAVVLFMVPGLSVTKALQQPGRPLRD
jgi:hypothetical protein